MKTAILNLVQRTARWLRLSWIATGLGLTLGVLAAVTVAAVALDLVWPLPVAGRWAALLVIIAATATAYGREVVRPVARRLTLAQVARRMEAFVPHIRNRLVTCVDLLAESPAAARFSPAFYERLLTETHTQMAGFAPRVVVDWPRLQLASAFAGVAVILLAGLVGLLPARAGTALARIGAPFADLPPVSAVAYEVRPGNAKVLRGDDVTFTATVTRGAPARLQVAIEPAGIVHDLQPAGSNVWEFTLAGAADSFAYRVRGGGTWSKRQQVTVVARPEIVELHTVLRYPDYLGALAPVAGAEDVTGPVGSTVEVQVKVQGPAVTGTVAQWFDPTNSLPVVSDPMRAGSNGLWVGRFPLVSNGFYRVELRNELGYANKPMQPGRVTVVADQPPQITIERPGTDVALGVKGKLPVMVAASDDFGLAEVVLVAGEQRWVLRKFDSPVSADLVAGTLDVAALGLKLGEAVRYRAEARDGKGQVTVSREFELRVVADNESADRVLTRLEERQATWSQRLTGLLGAQQTMQSKLGELAVRYAPLLEQWAEETAERPTPATTEALTNLLARAVLDGPNAKLWEGLQKRLAELAKTQQQQTGEAQQMATELAATLQEAGQSPLVPAQMTDQLRLLQQAFAQMAVAPMQDLRGALAQSGAPDVAGLQDLNQQAMQGLQAVNESAQETATATAQLASDPASALAALQSAQWQTQGRMADAELQQLQAALADLMAQLERFQAEQMQMLEQGAPEPAQQALAEQIEQTLEAVRQLQEPGEVRGMRREPQFPAQPWTPDHGEVLVPPREEDTEDPAAQAGTSGPKTAEESEEPVFAPALGGPRPKLDPRFADKLRPVARTPRAADGQPAGEPERSRGWERMQELNLAQQSAASDQQSVAGMRQELAQAQSAGQQSAGQQLQQALQSAQMQRAMQMAAQARGQQGQGQRGGPASLGMGLSGRLSSGGDVPALDVRTRTVILALPPRVREELLQGMREEGPAAYRELIRNYFEQLTKVRAP